MPKNKGREPGPPMKTRDRIVETALALFNEKGAVRVTTNHIAEAAGISPGNLYYHFRNKEEIVRAIFDRIIADFDLLYGRGKDAAPAAVVFFSVFIKTCDLYYRYRFFYLELATLLGQDPILKKRYVANLRTRFRQQKDYYGALIRAGVLLPSSEKELVGNLTNGWIISDFWLTWLYISDAKITPERIGESVRHIYLLLKPHLSPEADAEIRALLP
ncbi:MAG TPA: TetR/AcrR family transcriptional regulator [Spirochaetes bacterium]|nr:TetR/AcrR family transcriptional regulator [Spirochaetota bacterium]